MSTTAIDLSARLTRSESGALVGRTMAFVGATAGTFAVGAYLGRDWESSWSWLLTVVAFGLLFAINGAAQRSAGLAVTLLLGFGLVVGLSVAPALAYYARNDSGVLWQTGAATALFITGFGAAGYATRRDLSALARSLLWALVALIVFGVVLIFVQIPGGAVIYALAGLAIFAGLTAYDFQRLRREKDIRSAPLLAASIFLDIVNVFLLLLSLFGGSSDGK